VPDQHRRPRRPRTARREKIVERVAVLLPHHSEGFLSRGRFRILEKKRWMLSVLAGSELIEMSGPGTRTARATSLTVAQFPNALARFKLAAASGGRYVELLEFDDLADLIRKAHRDASTAQLAFAVAQPLNQVWRERLSHPCCGNRRLYRSTSELSNSRSNSAWSNSLAARSRRVLVAAGPSRYIAIRYSGVMTRTGKPS
jgi:hypothetical protein